MKTKRSTSEVGHTKNITNFASLIKILEEMGPRYNPTIPEIKINELKIFSESLNTKVQQLVDKMAPFRSAVAKRENAFAPLGKKMTRVQNSFKSLLIPVQNKENIIALTKKIRGDKPIKKAEKLENESTETISTAQLSYDSKTSNLQAMIALLRNYPMYNPNEEEIKVEKLQALYEELKQLNSEAIIATNVLITARKERNDLLYNNPVNTIELVTSIKNYIKSIEGANDYLKAVVKLKFKSK
jgi:hypothetical protein